MLITGRRAATISLVSAIVVGFSSPAWADDDYFFGNTECGESGGPGCEVGAESGQSSPGSPGSGSGGDGEAPEGGQDAAAEAEPACEQTGPGTMECDGLIPGGGEDADAVDPVEVAHAARDSLVVPDPQIATSPGDEVPVLVHVPVWLWISEDAWEAQTAEAAVPGGSVTVTASPAQAEWDMGDGSTVSCDGPGTAYDPREHDPAAESPTCGHTYRASTADPFPVEVEVTWEVSWSSSDGDGGDLDDLVSSASTERSVIESHGLVTGVD